MTASRLRRPCSEPLRAVLVRERMRMPFAMASSAHHAGSAHSHIALYKSLRLILLELEPARAWPTVIIKAVAVRVLAQQ